MNGIKSFAIIVIAILPTSAWAINLNGLGSEAGALGSTGQMTAICQRTYDNLSRWATTVDYDELLAENEFEDLAGLPPFALRATETIFTPDKRSYDQRTGAISPAGKYLYPGAVIVRSKSSVFAAQTKVVKPLCVEGN